VREEPPRPQLQELVALAAVAALGLYLLAHGEITAVVGEMASQTAAVATALAGAGMAARAAAWLLGRWGHG
jgi:hypothetical protein